MQVSQDAEKRKSVVVTDDSIVMRRIIASRVQKLGFEALHASNGREAMALLERQRDDVALVILDWNMPKMNGFETLKLLRGSERYRGIPVVMVTTESELQKVIAAIQHGAKNYVRKPFSDEELDNAILAALGRRPSKPQEPRQRAVHRSSSPALEGLKQVFEQTLNLEPTVSDTALQSARIGVVGSVQYRIGASTATVLLAFESSAAKRLIGTLLSVSSARIDEPLLHDGILEILNMVMGFVRHKMAAHGLMELEAARVHKDHELFKHLQSLADVRTWCVSTERGNLWVLEASEAGAT